MGYRVTTIDDLKKQNKEISSRKFKSVRNIAIMFSNLHLLSNAPKYEDINTTSYTGSSGIPMIQEEQTDEINKKEEKRSGVKTVRASRSRI